MVPNRKRDRRAPPCFVALPFPLDRAGVKCAQRAGVNIMDHRDYFTTDWHRLLIIGRHLQPRQTQRPHRTPEEPGAGELLRYFEVLKNVNMNCNNYCRKNKCG